jgi:hypothetical protein
MKYYIGFHTLNKGRWATKIEAVFEKISLWYLNFHVKRSLRSKSSDSDSWNICVEIAAVYGESTYSVPTHQMNPCKIGSACTRWNETDEEKLPNTYSGNQTLAFKTIEWLNACMKANKNF